MRRLHLLVACAAAAAASVEYVNVFLAFSDNAFTDGLAATMHSARAASRDPAALRFCLLSLEREKPAAVAFAETARAAVAPAVVVTTLATGYDGLVSTNSSRPHLASEHNILHHLLHARLFPDVAGVAVVLDTDVLVRGDLADLVALLGCRHDRKEGRGRHVRPWLEFVSLWE